MNDLVNFVLTIFVSIAMKFIQLYKWLEFQFLSYFSAYINSTFADRMAEIGIVLESSEINKCKRSDAQILKRCNKYDKVCRLQLINKHLLVKVINRGYLAMAEGYMNGDLKFKNDESDITEFLERCMDNNLNAFYFNFVNRLFHYLEYDCVNLQTSSRAWEVGKRHYDLGKSSFKILIFLVN